jgi:hypothetical protein
MQLALPLGFGFGSQGGQFTFSGTFADTRWSLGINGDFSDTPVHLSFGGVFNPNTNTGSYGSQLDSVNIVDGLT